MTVELCADPTVTLFDVVAQNISQLELEGTRRDFCSIVQSEHRVPHHQRSAEEVQDTGSRGARERGLCYVSFTDAWYTSISKIPRY